MIDNWEVVRLANKVDDLVLGTAESWIAYDYVNLYPAPSISSCIRR